MDAFWSRWSAPDGRGFFTLSLVVVTALAVLVATLEDRALLVEILVAGPLLAAASTGPSRTAIVAGYAFALSVAVGLAGDAFGSLQHVVGVALVGLGGLMAVAFARLRMRREELLLRERAARESATRARDELEAMLGGIADAVTGQAPDGSLIYANQAALDMLGFETAEELIATPPEELLARFDIFDESGDPFPPERLPGRRALAGEGVGEAVVRFRIRPSGEERWSVVKSTPVLDDDGYLRMAINVIEDITEHKRSELAEHFLSESSRLLASSLDPDEVLQQVAKLAVPEVADWCAVDVLREDGQLQPVALSHADPKLLKQALELGRRYPPRTDLDMGPANVVRTGRSELYEEISDELLHHVTRDERHFELVKELGMRSAMTVPLVARGGTLGAMTFASGPSGRRFDQRDVELAEELARRCGTAVENARLYDERAYIARTLQQSLLPAELPEIPGVQTAARFRPTGEGNEMGGDFYDLFPSGGRGWTVVVGDVCGKGPDAAAVTALARYTLRAAAMRDRLPSRGLHVLNEALLRQRSDRRFCTVAYAYLEPTPDGVRLGFASGGHPLPLLVHSDGAVEPVGAAGTLLGVVRDPSFEDRSVELAPGDALVFYTDGVIE
ncbi:MAG TPA: SpoIIE family protein phosphatase, partial [Thermoleophilaceae bacterium]|nr:SpoIIE family protein phosphatase [Thermoleophilaceae bacterium]